MALCITNPLLGPKSFQTRPPYPPLISLPTITTTTTIRAELNYSHPTGKSSSSSQQPSPATPATPKLTTKANPERPNDRENSKMDQNSSWHKLKKYLKRKFSKEKNLLQENRFDIDWVLLQSVVQRLTVSPPIVFAGEAHKLEERLGEAAMGNAFLLHAGDGSFEEINADTLRVILQMNSVLMFGGQMPVIKVGNQVARLASDLKLSTSHPDQSLMKAYQLQTGGYAAIQRVPQWDLDFMENSEHGDRYRELASQVDEALGFMLAAGHTVDHPTDFWTSHECLPYDGSLITCKYSTSSLSYDCSSHFLWVSERTCQLDGAHVKFLRGIGNPLGIKVSHKMDLKKLVKLIGILNPEKKPGRITIITRMGAENLKLKLPNIVREVKRVGQIVTWVTDPDPMPHNTIKASRSLKPHPFDAIRAEVRAFFDVHEQEGSHPGGVHLEMAGQNKTEVNSGSRTTTFGNTHCDPRLNAPQLLELAFIIAERLQKLHPTD